jgi:acyl-coenzyme A thioesterase PaaI-like protein
MRGDACVVDWTPEAHHEAFEGALNGGIIGTLLDCHMNWTAAMHLMQRSGLDMLPSTVTAEYQVKLLRPTPSRATVSLEARVLESNENRATVECTLQAEGKVCATGRGVFVAVPPGHPAYHRW